MQMVAYNRSLCRLRYSHYVIIYIPVPFVVRLKFNLHLLLTRHLYPWLKFCNRKNSSNPAQYISWFHFLYMNLGKVRKTFGGQVWVKYEPLVNWVSSDMHVGQEAMSCNVCIVAIPEICAQTQGSDYLQLIHWCQSHFKATYNSSMRLFSDRDEGVPRARQALFLKFLSWR